MSTLYKIDLQDRRHRAEFTKAYKVLYEEGEICYLTEILDSANEGFPFLWVNGEKYVFSDDVLESGSRTSKIFWQVVNFFNKLYQGVKSVDG